MITSINEFFFSNHYAYDSDNRFKLRVKEAIINNQFKDQALAESRFKKAMYFYGLGVLDKLATAINPLAIVFGNLYFRENKKLVLANISGDKNSGNIYTAIIKDQTVVTLLLYPSTFSNQDIFDKIKNHDNTEVKELRDIDNNVLSLGDRKRKNIIIDLDISDTEFNAEYPAISLKNNPMKGILTPSEIMAIEDEKKNAPKAAVYSPTAIPMEFKNLVPNKEYVIYTGMEVLVNYPDGPKKKKIRSLIVDEKGASRKFSLEFENTAKPMPLELGTTFIISPKIANEEYRKLIDAFNLEDGTQVNFIGPITKFNFYKKGKGNSDRDKLGVIIDPRTYF